MCYVMISLKTLLSYHIHSFLKHQKHTSHLLTNLHISSKTPFIYTNTHKYFTFTSFLQKSISDSVPIQSKMVDSVQIVENGDEHKNKKPLDIMFKEAVGFCEKLEQSDSESENDSDLKQTLRKLEKEVRKLKSKSKPLDIMFKEAVGFCEKLEQSDSESENDSDLKQTLRKLEKEVRKLKSKSNSNSNSKQKKEANRDNDSSKEIRPRSKSLHALFANKDSGGADMNLESLRKEPMVMKKISPDMLFFLSYLYEKGYFNDANFSSNKVFDVSWFDDTYGREYIKFAAEKFGKGNQEIARWLSGSDLKLLAQFGCPSLEKRSVFAAKRLRIFFKIQEDNVCSKCVLKQSCKFVNQSIWKGDTKNLHLIDVMKVITLYALEATPRQLVVPNEIKACVSRVLKEVVNLSQTTS